MTDDLPRLTETPDDFDRRRDPQREARALVRKLERMGQPISATPRPA